MSNKSNSDKAYDKGYNAGKNGDLMDDFVHGNKDIIPLPKGRHEGSYDGGYSDGAKDRHDNNNSHYQGGSDSGSSGDCFLTTACTIYKGLPDDCPQLETLRKFRDDYIANKPLGKDLIIEYYQKAPKVVIAIDAMNDESQEKVYSALFERINLACLLISVHKDEEAFNVYANTSRELFAAFVND